MIAALYILIDELSRDPLFADQTQSMKDNIVEKVIK